MRFVNVLICFAAPSLRADSPSVDFNRRLSQSRQRAEEAFHQYRPSFVPGPEDDTDTPEDLLQYQHDPLDDVSSEGSRF